MNKKQNIIKLFLTAGAVPAVIFMGIRNKVKMQFPKGEDIERIKNSFI